MCEVALLVELGLLETERVDNVVDLLDGILDTLLGLLGGSVGANIYPELSVRFIPRF
jgi:hypothetical protein